MYRILISFVMAIVGIQAYAVSGDFSGENRFRMNLSGSGSKLGSVISKDSINNNLNHQFRSLLSGSFRASESLVGNVDIYTNISGLIENGADVSISTYGDWMISDEVMLRVGRSNYEIADGSVIGLNDYEDVPTQLTGLFFTHSSEFFGADVVVARMNDSSLQNLAILSLDVRSLPDIIKQANIHLITHINSGVLEQEAGDQVVASEGVVDASATSNGDLLDTDVVRAGITIGGGMMGVSYRATIAHSNILDVGGEVSGQAMAEGKIGYAYDLDSSTIKLYGGYHWEGSAYDAFLYDVHKNAGMSDIIKWGNGLSYAKAGLSYWIDSDLGIGIVGHYVTSGNESKQDEINVGKDSAELDVYVKATFDSSVFLTVWGGLIQTGEESKNYIATAQANLSMRF